jgi:hypothetical protein
MKGLVAPKWINAGENTKLLCDFEMGQSRAYSIKWYKDGKELYRYVPTNSPSQYKSFTSPGVIVNVS